MTCNLQSGRSKYKTGVVSFLLCMTYHADITLTYFCIYNEFVTPTLKTFVFLSRYPIYRLKPLMNNLRTLATHIDGRKWKIKIFCGRKIFMKSGPSFSTFSQKVTPKMPCNFTSFINKLLYVSKMCSHDDIPNAISAGKQCFRLNWIRVRK